MAKDKEKNKTSKPRKNTYRMRFTLHTGRRVEVAAHSKAEKDQIDRHVPKLISAKRVGADCLESTEWGLRLPQGTLKDSLIRWQLIPDPRDSERTLADLREQILFNTPGKAPNTLSNYHTWFKALLDYANGATLLKDFTREMAYNYGVYLANRYKGGNSANRTFTAARTFFGRAIDLGWITTNPFDRLKPPTQKNDRKSKVTRITEDDMQRLRDNFYDKRWLAIIHLLRYGGVRGGSELENLFWDVDSLRWSTADSPCTITVISPKQRGRADKHSRPVALPPVCEKALLDWLYASGAQEQADFPHVRMFPEIHESMEAQRAKAQKQMEQKKRVEKVEYELNDDVKAIFNRIGINLGRTYDLRHNCLSDWLSAAEDGSTIDPALYTEMANHSLQVGMAFYQCLFPDRTAKGLKQLANRWKESPPISPPPAPIFAPGSIPHYPAACNRKSRLSLENMECCEEREKYREITQDENLHVQRVRRTAGNSPDSSSSRLG